MRILLDTHAFLFFILDRILHLRQKDDRMTTDRPI